MSSLTLEQFKDAELLIRRELDERILPNPAREIVRVLLQWTYMAGYVCVEVPRLSWFEQETGLARPHVSTTLRFLVENQIVAADWPAPKFYGINVHFSLWGAERKKQIGTRPRQLTLPNEESLRVLLTQVFIESAAPALRIDGSVGLPDPSGSARAGASCSSGSREPGDVQGGAIGDSASAESPKTPGARWVNPAALHARTGGPGTVDGGMPAPGGGVTKIVPLRTPYAPAEGVTKNVTTPPKPNDGAGLSGCTKNVTAAPSTAGKVFSPTPPLSKTLNVERSTFKRAVAGEGKGEGGAARPKVTWDEERRLMERISEFVGEDDMERSGAFWRERVVRNFPDLVDEAVSEGNYLVQTGSGILSRPAWLNNRIARLAGVRSLGSVKPGIRPWK